MSDPTSYIDRASELHGSSDGGDQVFTYLARHGITRDEATTPRQGLLAAIPTAGLAPVGGVVAGGVGGGLIGRFFRKGLKLTDQDLARVNGKLDTGHAFVGALAWDDEAERVADKLASLGGSLQALEGAAVASGPDAVDGP